MMREESKSDKPHQCGKNEVAIIIVPVESEQYRKIIKVINAEPPLTLRS